MKSLKSFEKSLNGLIIPKFENLINERNSFLHQNIDGDIKTKSWFQPTFTRKEAEKHLEDQDIGCFVIRLGHSKDFLALSLKSEDSKYDHYKIELEKSEDDSSLKWTTGVYILSPNLKNFPPPSFFNLISFPRKIEKWSTFCLVMW